MTSTRQWGSFRFPGHRAVVTVVDVAERLIKAADRFLKPYNLTLAQFNLLTVLMADREGLQQSALGDRLVVSRANITGLVRRMIRRGLCRILPEPGDRRIKRVQITPAGIRLLDRIDGPYFSEIGRVTGSMTASDLQRLSDLMDRLREGASGPGASRPRTSAGSG